MSNKSQRLIELMMTVNRKRKFTVRELADEFGVSRRTILRDLQELSGLGVPLYSEVGPHGGYQVLNERVLPPIAFTEEEAVAMFFASHALRHYSSLPFEEETASALKKFYFYMTGDVRDRIDQMKNRFDFVIPIRQQKTPYLSILLQAAVEQRVIKIEYKSKTEQTTREIQPIGVYASSGLWYCPAYCFIRKDIRLFRCDKITSDIQFSETKPIDLKHVHLGNRVSMRKGKNASLDLYVELTSEGVQRCEADIGSRFQVNVRRDGTGWLEDKIHTRDTLFLAKVFIGLGTDAMVQKPVELVNEMRRILVNIMDQYKENSQ
ncbi:YafY family transcriptional regulator [Shimazuella sp. AN120528]|uniref:helix-turn-helix transcriptional regulator n=1 Tax=Shimazuella soli TaxID=1892854 RepID=UPI001F1065DE|nr:YafY family protein [Shimazuella soli]MCH5585378.1 YafY family transcriptional regulator [Shimazuella soli]